MERLAKLSISAVALSVLLAGCTTHNTPVVQAPQTPAAENVSTQESATVEVWRQYYEANVFDRGSTKTPYQMMLPEQFDPQKTYPVVLFLHGAGERGTDNQAQLNNGGKLFAEHRSDFPAIVIFPQAPAEDYWAAAIADRSQLPFSFDYPYTGENDVPATDALKGVMAITDWLSEQPFVDTSRMYLMGLSIGGMGSYELLARKPDTFAAAVIICGGANAELAGNIRSDLPVWAFHGDVDQVVIPEYNIRMVEGLKAQGNPVKFTTYPGVNHNSWDPALAEPELLPWLFSQKK